VRSFDVLNRNNHTDRHNPILTLLKYLSGGCQVTKSPRLYMLFCTAVLGILPVTRHVLAYLLSLNPPTSTDYVARAEHQNQKYTYSQCRFNQCNTINYAF
jgi:hypothetical protein